MLWFVVLTLLGLPFVGAGDGFTWLKRPGDNVHACVGEDAYFQWDYDNTTFSIQQVTYRFTGTKKSVLTYFIETGSPPAHYEYGNRSAFNSQTAAGLILKDVRKADEGEYTIEPSYPATIDEAQLKVYTRSDLLPVVRVNNVNVSFGTKLNIRKDRVTITVSPKHLLADIDIRVVQDGSEAVAECRSVDSCSEVVMTNGSPTATIHISVAYDICAPYTGDIVIETYTAADVTTPTPTEGPDEESSIIMIIIIIAVLVVIIILVVVACLVFLWCNWERVRQRNGSISRGKATYIDCCVWTPLRYVHTKCCPADEERPNTPESELHVDAIPFLEKNPFKIAAKDRGLSEDTINILLEQDFNSVEVVKMMRDQDTEEMGISGEEAECLKQWRDSIIAHNSQSPGKPPAAEDPGEDVDLDVKRCIQQLNFGEQRKDAIQNYVGKNGTKGLQEYIKQELEKCMNVPVALAVTGRSGTGKSSLINTLRGMGPKEKGAAAVGVTETTSTLHPYSFPRQSKLVIWDMPGVDTPRFPRVSYLDDVEFRKYDCFIIVGTTRFSEDDLWLANEARKLGKQFYFLRNKVDLDIENSRRDSDCPEAEVLSKIKKNVEDNLKAEGLPSKKIYLLSSILSNSFKWDFPRFANELVYNTPERNRASLVMGMVSCSVEIISQKKVPTATLR